MRAVFDDNENENLLLETGYKTAILHLDISQRTSLLSVILDYHCFIKAKAANDQFLEGLQLTGVLDYVKKFPEIMKPLFCFNKSMLTAGKGNIANTCTHCLAVKLTTILGCGNLIPNEATM